MPIYAYILIALGAFGWGLWLAAHRTVRRLELLLDNELASHAHTMDLMRRALLVATQLQDTDARTLAGYRPLWPEPIRKGMPT